MAVTVLLVESEEALREAVRAKLKEKGHHLLSFGTAQAALKSLGEVHPLLAVLSGSDQDPCMGDLEEALRSEPKCQVVWVVPPGGEAEALAKEHRPRGLVTRESLPRETALLAERIEERRERATFLAEVPPLYGDSPVMRDLRWLLDKVAQGGAPTVLITGESGTGKEVAARHLHYHGPRREEPFVEVDCASVPAGLLESTLFGHEAGAFTDAKQARRGLLELAQGGTVFLDEIGEIDMALQAKLLRVLDTKRVRPLGATREIHLDVHWIAATNRKLEEEVERGAFRADLFYRLDVVRVALPPLRSRGSDVVLLAKKFLEESARRLGRDPLELDPVMVEQLEGYPWPGNVRELKNHMERLCLRGGAAPLPVGGPRSRVQVDFSLGPVQWSEVEREILVEALKAADGNISEAARLLGLGRGAMRYRLQRYDLSGELDEAA